MYVPEEDMDDGVEYTYDADGNPLIIINNEKNTEFRKRVGYGKF